MNILWVTYGLPYPPHSGARVRDFYLLRAMAEKHRVTCVCLLEADDTLENLAVLESLGIKVYGFPQQTVTLPGYALSLLHHFAAHRPLATYSLWNAPMFECVRDLLAT